MKSCMQWNSFYVQVTVEPGTNLEITSICFHNRPMFNSLSSPELIVESLQDTLIIGLCSIHCQVRS